MHLGPFKWWRRKVELLDAWRQILPTDLEHIPRPSLLDLEEHE